MGLSKRAAETIVAGLSGQGTTFVSVRFGNVLGSRGSVLPIFNRQIERGVPITVTDTDATRYFMLISEAVELVLQAGRLGSDGEVYVLDMGEPLRITDLAENLVRLAGLEPHVDVPIDVVGLRPGERLHENAGVGRDEVSIPAQHDRIRVVRKAGTINGLFSARLNELRERFIAEDAAGCVESLRAVASAPVDELRRQ
jgi:FlaA1/EpsC-like NDP-sugar epimerase